MAHCQTFSPAEPSLSDFSILLPQFLLFYTCTVARPAPLRRCFLISPATSPTRQLLWPLLATTPVATTQQRAYDHGVPGYMFQFREASCAGNAAQGPWTKAWFLVSKERTCDGVLAFGNHRWMGNLLASLCCWRDPGSELAALSFPRIVTWPASSAQFVPSLRLSQAYENEWGRVTA